EADAAAAFLDREHQHLDLAAHREGLAGIGAPAHGELSRGHETRLARTEAHEDAERFVALHRPREPGTHLHARFHLLADRGALGRQRQRDAALVAIDADDEHADLAAGGRRFPQGPLTAARNLRDVQKAVDTRHELDEHPELGRAHGAPAHDLALTQPAGYPGPRIPLEGLQAERDPPFLRVEPEHLDGHRIADAQQVGRTAHARMRELGQRHEALHAAQVDERAEVDERGDRPREHRARHDLLARLLGYLGGALLEQAAAG